MKKICTAILASLSLFGFAYAQDSDWSITHSCEPVTALIQEYVRGNRENQYEMKQVRLKREQNYEYCIDQLEAGTSSRRDIIFRNQPSKSTEDYIEYLDDDYYGQLDDDTRCNRYGSTYEDENGFPVFNLPTQIPDTGGGGGPTKQFSDTNNQKKNIQEADYLKSNGKNIFKVQGNQISIFKVNGGGNVEANHNIGTIYLPETQWKMSELLLVDNTLVVVNLPTVLLYDISNPLNPILQRKISFRGSSVYDRGGFVREVDGVLYIKGSYVIQTLDILEEFDTKEEILLSPTDYLPVLDDLQLSYEQGDYSLQGVSYPYEFTRTQFDCPQMLMSPGSVGSNYDLIFKINLKDPKQDIETVGYMGNSLFHMGSESIYMIQNDGYSYDGLISKIPYKQGIFGFAYHQEFNGKPIGNWGADKYSMDENDQGEFRMFVTRGRNKGTDVLTFGQDLEPLGSILGIQSDESFQGGLFLGDKGYLVTFRQTDPLFVIDLADATRPTIVGELKIPGFSEYLHPYAPMQGGIQYLLGLGYDAEEEFGRSTGLKLDLYKIDYNKIDYNRIGFGNISVEQLHSKVREGRTAYSSALQNPKNFVWNPNKTLILPIESGLWSVSNNNDPKFNGFKVLSVTPGGGIQERFSKNLVDWGFVNKFNGGFYVGYVGQTLYGLHKEFAHFVDMTNFEEKHITTSYVGNVNNDPEFIEALSWMYGNGLTKYNGPVKYRPHDQVTNEQSTKFFVQLYKLLNQDRNYDVSVMDTDFISTKYTIDYSLEPYAKILLYDLGFEIGGFYNRQQGLTREQISYVLVNMLNLVEEDDPNKVSFLYNCDILKKQGLIKVCDSSLGITRYHMALLLYRAYISTLDEDTVEEFKKHQDWRRLGVEVY